MSDLSPAQKARQDARDNGGKYAEYASPSNAGALSLDIGPESWGEPAVRVGSTTPWGPAQDVERWADGVSFVTAEGHGGFKLSPERNAKIPRPLRRPGGWYEEDCEAAVVMWVHGADMEGGDQLTEEGLAGVKNWFPDEYTALTGEHLEPSESYALSERLRKADREAWRAAHADRFISRTNVDADLVPDGCDIVHATRPADGQERVFVVAKGFYASDHMTVDHLVDEENAIDVTDLYRSYREDLLAGRKDPRDDAPVVHELRFSTEGMTPAQAERVEKDMAIRWRRSDGTSATLAECCRADGLLGKSATAGDNGRHSYYLVGPTGDSYPVTKATWDAVSLPDLRSREDLLIQARSQADHALRKAQDTLYRTRPGTDARTKAESLVRGLREKADAADAEARRSLHERGEQVRAVRRAAKESITAFVEGNRHLLGGPR